MRIESLDLELTTKCNLACSYCYIGCGALENRGDMTDEHIEMVLDLIEQKGFPRPFQMEGGRQQQATIVSFYGGEPLLSFRKLQRVVDRSVERGMQLRFTVLSNGTTGTPEQIKWLQERNIWTQRSIDGHPEAQEKYRANSIDLYKKKNEIWKDYGSSRRSTIRPEFAKDLLKTQKFFESMGFEAGFAPMPDFYCEWSDEHIEDFKKSLWDLGKYYLEKWHAGKPFYNYYFSREMWTRFGSGRAEQHGCGGGIGLYCVSWDGWIYLCHRFSKEPHDSDVCVGYIKDVIEGTAKGLGKMITDQIAIHKENNPKNWRPECKACIAQYSCEKGCMHTNLKACGDLQKCPKLYCAIRQESAKIVAWLDTELRAVDSEWWTRGNHLARNYKPNTVASNLLTKGIETMIGRAIAQATRQNNGNNCNCKRSR